MVSINLLPVTWPTITRLLEDRPNDLCAFEWHRAGVLPAARRTLAEIRESGGRFSRIERAGTALGVLCVLVGLLLIVRAVFS